MMKRIYRAVDGDSDKPDHGIESELDDRIAGKSITECIEEIENKDYRRIFNGMSY